jgi:hypothetical protein
LVGIYEPQVSFLKNMFQPLLVKKLFIQNMTLNGSEDIDKLLKQNIGELINLVRAGSANDFQAIYDSFLPVIISQTSLFLSFRGEFLFI